MGKTAYQGRKLGEAVDVWENMIKEKDTRHRHGLCRLHEHRGAMDNN